MTEYEPRTGQFGADCFHCHGGATSPPTALRTTDWTPNSKTPAVTQVTKKAGDQGKFAVPSLRNVAITAPYMHDGRFQTLEEVVEHYSSGVKRSATLDPNSPSIPQAA